MIAKKKLSHIVGSPDWWAGRPVTTVKSGTPPVGRPSIGFDRIVAAAIHIVDEEGTEALSMRKLAERLGSGTATLYRYFDSRDEILVYVVDSLLGEIEMDAAGLQPSGWRQACLHGAEAVYGLLRRHPNVIPLVGAQIPVGPNALAQREKAISVLLSSGLSPSLAARAYSGIMNYVFGAAQQLGGSGRRQVTGSQLREFYRSLDKSTHPATVSVADDLPMISDEDDFRFGLQLIIEGLAACRRKKLV